MLRELEISQVIVKALFYRHVGGIAGFETEPKPVINCKYLRFVSGAQYPTCYGVHKKEMCGIEPMIHTFLSINFIE